MPKLSTGHVHKFGSLLLACQGLFMYRPEETQTVMLSSGT
jgi:hypothetical protein